MQSDNLIDAAKAVLAQWDTPNWKLTEPTAKLMADLRKAVDEAALSAAEPARWMWEERRFAESDIWDDMYDDEPPAPQKYVRNIRPLYAAPPAPSVAVEHLITEVHDAIDEYREGMKGDKFGPHEWPTVDGIKTTVAQSLRRSALSAQVQDVVGWQSMDTAPKDGKHCLLAVKLGPFVYAVQGAYSMGEWGNAADIHSKPLCWMPLTRIPPVYLPWTDEFAAAAPAKQEG